MSNENCPLGPLTRPCVPTAGQMLLTSGAVGLTHQAAQRGVDIAWSGQSKVRVVSVGAKPLAARPERVVDVPRQPQPEVERALAHDQAGEAYADHEDDTRLLRVDGQGPETSRQADQRPEGLAQRRVAAPEVLSDRVPAARVR